MPKTIHMCVSVRGMLNWKDGEAKRNLKTMTNKDGNRFQSVHEFRNALMDELAKGHDVLPLGEACEGFDYKSGCPGHDACRNTRDQQ